MLATRLWRFFRRGGLGAVGLLLGVLPSLAEVDPLPSWNDGPAKTAIISFVDRVTSQASPDFVPVAERLAVFDKDGTLAVEQPMPPQLAFERDCVDLQKNAHPEWATTQPFEALLAEDTAVLSRAGVAGISQVLMASHEGWTTDVYEATVSTWVSTERDQHFNQPPSKLVYQPMLELMRFFKANGFEIYILSDISADFLRPWAATVFGVPPDHVIGSSIGTAFEVEYGQAQLKRVRGISLVGDGADRAVKIHERLGRRPIAVFGNSDDDLQLLEWATLAAGAHLGAIVHHTDTEREYAYDRHAQFGALDQVLDAAAGNGWTVIDMKADWKTIFSFQAK